MSIDRQKSLDKPGIYTLVIFVAQPVRTVVGKLGYQDFHPGFYTYTGSAIGRSTRLRVRVGRHLAFRKKLHWHIDYLLTSKVVTVKAVVYAETTSKMECQVVKEIKQQIGVKALVRGFGASDCRYRCVAHLHYYPGLDFDKLLNQIIKVYKKLFNDTLSSDGQTHMTECDTNNVSWIITMGC